MTDKIMDYTPQEEVTYVYAVSLPVVKVLTGVVTSDAPEEITKEIFLDHFKEEAEGAEFLEFRPATDEEIEFFQENIDNETVN